MGVTKDITIPRQSTDDILGLNEHEDAPKQPTPLLGSWADVWSSRQTSDIILDDLDCKDSDCAINLTPDNAYELAAEEAAADEENADAHSDDADMIAVPTSDEPSPAVSSTAEDLHQRHVYTYNPYSLEAPRVDVYVCQCTDCIAINQAMHAEIAAAQAAMMHPPADEAEAFSPRVHIKTAKLSAPAESTNPGPRPISGGSPLGPVTAPAARAAGGFQTHSNVAPPPRHQQQAYVSSFMPPPPPSLQTKATLERNGSFDVETFVYHTMMRWYTKVQNVEAYFVPESDLCPSPDLNQGSFDDWCKATNDWWYRHFEFAQLKPHAYFQASTNGGYYLQHSNTSPYRNGKDSAKQAW